MWALSLPLLSAVSTYALPTARHVEKRHFDCWGSNVQGCGYSTAGYSGAAVSVCPRYPHHLLSEFVWLTVGKEVGTCSSIGVDIMAQGGNAADGEPLAKPMEI